MTRAPSSAGVEPDGLVATAGEQGGQQARRPHLAKSQQAVALEAIKLPFQGLGDLLHVVGQLLAQVEQQLPLQQAVDQALLVGVQGSDGFARGLVTRLGQLHQLDQPVGGLARGGDHHQLVAPHLLLDNAGDPAITDRIRQAAAAELVHMAPLEDCLCRHHTLSLLLFHYFTCSACCANCACSKP